MLSQKPALTVTINERRYVLECDSGAPLGELHDAIQQMKGWVIKRMQEEYQKEQAAAAAMKKEEDGNEETEQSSEA